MIPDRDTGHFGYRKVSNLRYSTLILSPLREIRIKFSDVFLLSKLLALNFISSQDNRDHIKVEYLKFGTLRYSGI